MNRINTLFKQATVFAVSGAIVTSFTFTNSALAGELQIGRYRTVILQPTEEQVDLLSGTVDVEFSQEIRTVGQAVEHLLDGSGYRLLSAKLAEPYRVLLFGLPLPQAHRRLGPLSLRQALELLSRPAFHLQIDPVYRLVTFELVPTSESGESDACSRQ